MYATSPRWSPCCALTKLAGEQGARRHTGQGAQVRRPRHGERMQGLHVVRVRSSALLTPTRSAMCARSSAALTKSTPLGSPPTKTCAEGWCWKHVWQDLLCQRRQAAWAAVHALHLHSMAPAMLTLSVVSRASDVPFLMPLKLWRCRTSTGAKAGSGPVGRRPGRSPPRLRSQPRRRSQLRLRLRVQRLRSRLRPPSRSQLRLRPPGERSRGCSDRAGSRRPPWRGACGEGSGAAPALASSARFLSAAATSSGWAASSCWTSFKTGRTASSSPVGCRGRVMHQALTGASAGQPCR